MELEDQIEKNAQAEEDTPVSEEIDREELQEDESIEADEDEAAVANAQIAELATQNAALNDQLLRARAEFDNYRKRVARENERTRLMAAESIIRDVLPVLDSLELALQHRDTGPEALSEGIDMVLKQMRDVLERAGVKPIEALGIVFDPNMHEAIAKVESEDIEENHVAEVFQKGYALGDQVIRPSKVVVSAGVPSPAEEIEDETIN